MMKHSALLALLALAGSASAGITFQEQVILANIGSTPTIPSVGLSGNPANATFIRTLTGRAQGNPDQQYVLRTIEIIGSLSAINGGSFAREAVIRVQPPNFAQAFYIQPFLQASVNATSLPIFNVHATVPVGGSYLTQPTGDWTFTFEETFDDISGTGVDAVWQTAVINFSDVATNPPAADPNGSFPLDFGPVNSDGTSSAPGVTGLFGLAAEEGPYNGLRITGQVTTTINGTTNSFDPQSSDVRLRFTPPSGTPFTVAPVITGTNALSTATVDVTVPYVGQQSGEWLLQAFENIDTPGGVDNVWNNLRLQLVTIPPPANAFDFGGFTGVSPSSPELFRQGRFDAPTFNSIQWYTFSVGTTVSPESGYYLDLDTVDTFTFGGVTDTEMAVYTGNGTLIAEDDDDGPSTWSQLTFGSNLARPVINASGSNGAARNGSDGVLPVGTYYVVNVNFNASFDPVFQVAFPTSDIFRIVNLRTNLSDEIAPSPCGIADLGAEGGAEFADSLLDNNDFIVFISLFFNNDPRADLGSEGGADSPDGLFDNNDFIVFIGAFFAGQTNEGCNDIR